MLHPKLKRFINQKNGSFLVTGPPGTGKTYLLVELILYLINKKKIDPSRVLIFCFNRRWAKILREKTIESSGRSIFEIPITTFFSFCADFVEKTFYLKKLSHQEKSETFDYCSEIKILNATQQWKLLKEVIFSLNKKNYHLTFRHMEGNPDVCDSFLQEVFDFILRAQENLLTPKNLSDKFTPFFNPLLSEIVGIYANYNELLLSRNFYNYGRLLFDTVAALRDNSSLRDSFRKAYDFIMVDELQELNNAQFQIANLLSDSNLIFFGNDDESVYTFRGSTVNNFGIVLQSIYQKHDPEKNILFLRKNYRNNDFINRLSGNFIDLNEGRLSKSSNATAFLTGKNWDDGVYDSVIIKDFKTTLDEINFIIEQIKKLIIIKKVKPEEICILVKGLVYKTRLIENAFKQNEILYNYRSSRTILESLAVQYIINFLKFITLLTDKNESIVKDNEFAETKGDRINLKNRLLESILGSIFIGISPLFVKRMSYGGSNVSGRGNDLWESICSLNDKDLKKVYPDLENFEGKELVKLIDFKNKVMSILKFINLNVYDFVIKFLNSESIGIINFLLKEKTVSGFERESYFNILGDYLESLKDFSGNNSGSDSIRDYLLFLGDIEGNNFLEEMEESTKEIIKHGHVNVLSYHHCKGLEFEAVFMPFINKNYLPAPFGKTQLYDLQIFNYFSGGKVLGEEIVRKNHMEDERNLFYTGMTRAKSYLFITANKLEDKSVFFEELATIYQSIKKCLRKRYKQNKER